MCLYVFSNRLCNKQVGELSSCYKCLSFSCERYRLVGVVVKVSTLRAEDPGFDSHLRCGPDFSKSSHTSDLEIGTPMAL